MRWLSQLIVMGGVISVVPILSPETAEAQQTRCVAIDLYFHGGQTESLGSQRILNKFVRNRRGVSVIVHDLDGSDAEESRKRLSLLAQHYRFDPETVPVIDAGNRLILGTSDSDDLSAKLKELLQVDVYVRSGCPRPATRSICETAKLFAELFR